MTAPTGEDRARTAERDLADSSVGDLIGEVARDLSVLLRQELALAKAEVREEAGRTGKAAGMVGAAGFAGYMVVLFLSFALWWGLSNAMDQGWAALIVAAIWAVAAGFLYSTGRRKLAGLHPKPERTVETLSEIPGAVRGR